MPEAPTMMYRTLADAVVILHFLFVAFVVFGGFVAWRWHRVAWIHIPAAVWGVAIEFGGWVCPLTSVENALRARAGLAGYSSGFVEHHVLPWLYPVTLTPPRQVVLGALALFVNLVAYGLLLRRPQHRDRDRR
jgi:hypothetical protein